MLVLPLASAQFMPPAGEEDLMLLQESAKRCLLFYKTYSLIKTNNNNLIRYLHIEIKRQSKDNSLYEKFWRH